MKKTHLLLGLSLAGALALSLPAVASDFYVFADGGRTTLNIEHEDDTTENGFSIGAGYLIGDTFAIEVAYRDLVEYNEKYNEITSIGAVSYEADATLTAIQASVLAKHQFGEKFGIYGRLGVAELELELDERASVGSSSYSESDSVSKTKALLGVGLSYAVTPAFSLRTEYTHYQEWEDLQISTMNIGATYRF